MDHGLMLGMFIGGVVMSLPPVLLGIGVGVYVLRRRRQEAQPVSGRRHAVQQEGAAS